MGNFNAELLDNYYDFVFSISTLEHILPEDNESFDKIINDINRVLRPGSYSLHLLDIVFKKDHLWANKIVHRIFERINTLNHFVSEDIMRYEPDLYYMSEEAYNKTWIKKIKKSYEEFGRPSSINILWRKPL
jgi:ubiquinone/menaquinone biosynthesis C-methylase UbiE